METTWEKMSDRHLRQKDKLDNAAQRDYRVVRVHEWHKKTSKIRCYVPELNLFSPSRRLALYRRTLRNFLQSTVKLKNDLPSAILINDYDKAVFEKCYANIGNCSGLRVSMSDEQDVIAVPACVVFNAAGITPVPTTSNEPPAPCPALRAAAHITELHRRSRSHEKEIRDDILEPFPILLIRNA
ncbi:hypothetical protein EVAR_16620_1 [Eumeta japonica]|uniref:Uncharacterized protein n=1 Tax=Eumeta variegata TaxID=151549 RepID=A0A4C1V0Q2_EUMVA|nr:hypothetical protein EVAR_16620_1 [Eumeta japonica]